MSRKDKFADDGRTIAPMDIDGMPGVPAQRFRTKKRAPDPDRPVLTPKEQRQIAASAALAGAAVALIMIAAAAIVIALIYFLG